MAKGHDKLTPEGKRFFAEIEKLISQQVRVGYQQGEATDENGVDLVDIATFNELGTANIPARPFLRNSVDTNIDTIGKTGVAQLENIIKGGTAEQALDAIGSMQKGLIQDTITKSKDWAEPNAPSTVKKKRSDTPLIDKGGLLDNVDYVIVPKGSTD